MKLGRVKQPPGGWRYPVAEGVTLTAINEEKLTNQIHEYRIRNNIPPGDIERDIDTYYCTNWPESCQKEPSDYVGPSAPSSPPREPMMNRVTRWVTTLISRTPRGGYSMVSAAEASRRSLICASCPANKPWRPAGCPGCSSNVASLLLQVRGLRRTPHDAALYACNFGGWGNDAAVHLAPTEMALTDAQKAELPDKCWRKAA